MARRFKEVSVYLIVAQRTPDSPFRDRYVVHARDAQDALDRLRRVLGQDMVASEIQTAATNVRVV